MTDDRCCDLDLSGGLGERAHDLAVAGFAAIWHGQGLPVGEHADVVAALVARGRCEVDADVIVGIHGLTLRTTRHHFTHRGAARRTWCAFDSIGIPAALQIDAIAHTDCPACERTITVEIERGKPTDARGLALWLPDATGEHLMESFCAAADLYCSPAHVADRIDVAATAGAVTDLAAAVALGRETWADIADLDLDRSDH